MPGEMEIQIKVEEMLVDVASHAPDGFLGDTGKDRITKLLKQGCAYPGRAIWECSESKAGFKVLSRLTGDNHGAGYCAHRPANGSKVDIHRVHDAFEIERDLYIQ